MRSEDPEAQATAHQLVHCVLDADSDGLTETLETVVDPVHELRPYVREVVAELINVATSAVRASVSRAGPLPGNAAYAVDLRDDADDRVGIDELEPPVRATIRAMLAELNGSPDDASFQLDLAVRGVDRRTGLDTVRRALTMTIGLLHWSKQGTMDPTTNEADLVEQRLDAVPDPEYFDTDADHDPGLVDDIAEADPADVQEQQRAVPEDDDR
jgi:hypothetical protein